MSDRDMKPAIDEIKRLIEILERDDVYGEDLIKAADGARYVALTMAGVECPKCLTTGRYNYPNTGTWLSARVGGLAGQAFTDDVCDECWGTGRTDKKGPDLFDMWQRADKAALKWQIVKYTRPPKDPDDYNAGQESEEVLICDPEKKDLRLARLVQLEDMDPFWRESTEGWTLKLEDFTHWALPPLPSPRRPPQKVEPSG